MKDADAERKKKKFKEERGRGNRQGIPRSYLLCRSFALEVSEEGKRSNPGRKGGKKRKGNIELVSSLRRSISSSWLRVRKKKKVPGKGKGGKEGGKRRSSCRAGFWLRHRALGGAAPDEGAREGEEGEKIR